MCESITGAALCEDLQHTLIKLKLNLQNSVSQTYDGAANFSGQIKGWALLFQKTAPHAQYFHCSSLGLNLALCHTCHGIPEVRNMLTCMIEIKLFFRYSPEGTVVRIYYHSWKHEERTQQENEYYQDQMFLWDKMDSETCGPGRNPCVVWTYTQNTRENNHWEGLGQKATDSAHSLMKSQTDPTFLVVLNVCSYVLGFTKPFSIMLKATAMDVITADQNIRQVKEQLKTMRINIDKVFEEDVWARATKLATITEVELTLPRVCHRMTRRTNLPSTTPQEY